ncbi:protein of unknown function [Agreia sp. COWG]|nr:protein of unknown function [Agreia sp. COWG]
MVSAGTGVGARLHELSCELRLTDLAAPPQTFAVCYLTLVLHRRQNVQIIHGWHRRRRTLSCESPSLWA